MKQFKLSRIWLTSSSENTKHMTSIITSHMISTVNKSFFSSRRLLYHSSSMIVIFCSWNSILVTLKAFSSVIFVSMIWLFYMSLTRWRSAFFIKTDQQISIRWAWFAQLKCSLTMQSRCISRQIRLILMKRSFSSIMKTITTNDDAIFIVWWVKKTSMSICTWFAHSVENRKDDNLHLHRTDKAETR